MKKMKKMNIPHNVTVIIYYYMYVHLITLKRKKACPTSHCLEASLGQSIDNRLFPGNQREHELSFEHKTNE